MTSYTQQTKDAHYAERADEDVKVERSPTQARQGRLGRPVLAVLVVGLILAALAWAGVEYAVYSGDPAQEPVQGETSRDSAPPVANDNGDDATSVTDTDTAQPI